MLLSHYLSDFFVRGLEVKIRKIVSMPVMQRQELPPRLLKMDFSAIGFVPNVPHDPIGILLERKLSCGIDGQLAVSRRLVIQPKLNRLRGMRIHGHDSVATRLL